MLTGDLKEFAENHFHKKCSIKFGWTINSPENRSFHPHYDVPYGHYYADVIILKLVKPGTGMLPRRFLLSENKSDKYRFVDILGHPNGGQLMIDPDCQIVNNQSDLDLLKTDAILFFCEQLSPPLAEDKKYRIKQDYKDLNLEDNSILTHCSSSFGKGISGGPCFIFDKEKGAPVVVATVQAGIPKSFYICFYDGQREQSKKKPRLFLERSLKTARIKQLIEESWVTRDKTTQQSCQDLCNDIFSQKLTVSTVSAGTMFMSFK